MKKGVPFREAHEAVAQAVRYAETRGQDLSEIELENLKQFSGLIEADVAQVLTLRGSLNARTVLGGTAPSQVRLQIERHRARLGTG